MTSSFTTTISAIRSCPARWSRGCVCPICTESTCTDSSAIESIHNTGSCAVSRLFENLSKLFVFYTGVESGSKQGSCSYSYFSAIFRFPSASAHTFVADRCTCCCLPRVHWATYEAIPSTLSKHPVPSDDGSSSLSSSKQASGRALAHIFLSVEFFGTCQINHVRLLLLQMFN